MVRLKNIARIDNQIICDAYVEDCLEPIALILDGTTGGLADFSFPKGYEYCASHIFIHAKRCLEELIKKDTVPTEQTVMWY